MKRQKFLEELQEQKNNVQGVNLKKADLWNANLGCVLSSKYDDGSHKFDS